MKTLHCLSSHFQDYRIRKQLYAAYDAGDTETLMKLSARFDAQQLSLLRAQKEKRTAR